MHNMFKSLFTSSSTQNPPGNPYEHKTSLQILWENIQRNNLINKSHQEPSWKSKTNALNVTIYPFKQLIWGNNLRRKNCRQTARNVTMDILIYIICLFVVWSFMPIPIDFLFDWQRHYLIESHWCWCGLILIDADSDWCWFWLVLIDSESCRLILIDSVRCWLMLK